MKWILLHADEDTEAQSGVNYFVQGNVAVKRWHCHVDTGDCIQVCVLNHHAAAAPLCVKVPQGSLDQAGCAWTFQPLLFPDSLKNGILWNTLW